MGLKIWCNNIELIEIILQAATTNAIEYDKTENIWVRSDIIYNTVDSNSCNN